MKRPEAKAHDQAAITTSTTYEYIHFVKVEQREKTAVWSCRNNKSGDELGIVKWHGPWRAYCFFPSGPAVYSAGCLIDLAEFMGKRTS